MFNVEVHKEFQYETFATDCFYREPGSLLRVIFPGHFSFFISIQFLLSEVR